MYRTIFWIAWVSLKRDRVALALSFALPLIFFSIFVGIFGGLAGGGGNGLPEVSLVLVDEDASPESEQLLQALVDEDGLRGPGRDAPQPRVLEDRGEARRLIEQGECDVAVVIPDGFGQQAFSSEVTLTLYADVTANPVAHQLVQGLIQKTAASGGLMMRHGLELFEKYGGELTPQQRQAVSHWLGPQEPGATHTSQKSTGVIAVALEDVRRPDASSTDRARLVAFQAAGIGVMFLLFSMSAAASSLLKEEQTGTLERLLNSNVGMSGLLAGYWFFAAALGCLQVTLMFVWGWAVFGLDLMTPDHLIGFLIMTPLTAAAAAGFGLVLGTACRSLPQLNALSTIVILIMSALGGSMIPRFLMSRNPILDKLGLLTFNAWAIDGYQKVFWYETGLGKLWPQVTVLASLTLVFLATARRLARRWECS